MGKLHNCKLYNSSKQSFKCTSAMLANVSFHKALKYRYLLAWDVYRGEFDAHLGFTFIYFVLHTCKLEFMYSTLSFFEKNQLIGRRELRNAD